MDSRAERTPELLAALTTEGDRLGDIARKLDVDEGRALAMLRRAEAAGLVAEEEDQSIHNVPPDFERRFWHLTDAGRAKLEPDA